MTIEQVNQIAEEYADMYMDQNIPLISKKDNIRNTFIQNAKTVISILSKRYCIVEKEKVVETYNDITYDARYMPEFDNKVLFDYDVESYFHYLFGYNVFDNDDNC